MNVGNRRRGGRRAPMAEINVTPFVDVMLVLLIIFMVTAPLLTAGVEVNLPQSRAGALDQEQKPVMISLDRSGEVFIGEDAVDSAALPDRLAQLGNAATPPQVYLRADTALDYGRVMAVMIRALQHQSDAPSQTVAPVRTTAAGTPMDIEVGANFRDALEGGAIRARQKTGTGGAAAAPSPRAAPPENLALRQATAARPD